MQLNIPNVSNDQHIIFSLYYQIDRSSVQPSIDRDVVATVCLNQNQNCCIDLSANPSPKKSNWSYSQIEINQIHSACMVEKVNRIDVTLLSSDNINRLNLGRLIIANQAKGQKLKEHQAGALRQKVEKDQLSFNGKWLSWHQVPKAIGYDLYSKEKFIGETPFTSFWVSDSDPQEIDVVPFFADRHETIN